MQGSGREPVDDKRRRIAKRRLEPAVQLRPKGPRAYSRSRGGGRNPGAHRFTLERVLTAVVVASGSCPTRDTKHLEHRRGVSGRIVTLDATGVEPRHVNSLAPEAVGEPHVVRHQPYMAKANSLQRSCNVLRNSFIAFPAACVAGLVKHTSRSGLVAAEDDGDPHPRHQPLDFLLQTVHFAGILPAAIGARLGCRLRRIRTHNGAPRLM